MLSWRMSSTTILLGRLLGRYLVAVSIGMLVNRRRTLATLDEMARSGPWMLFSGMQSPGSRPSSVTISGAAARAGRRHARRVGPRC